MLQRGESYDEVYGRFRWQVPERFNMASACCERHAAARGDAPALLFLEEDGQLRHYSFAEVRALSSRLANVLTAHGVARGDRLAILLPQSPEAAVAHMACYKAGIIALPLFTLFGEEALEYRLANSGAKAVLTDEANFPKIAALSERLPELGLVIVARGESNAAALPDGTIDFARSLAKAADRFAVLDTAADDPALIIYTSGTTGPPKGALHAQRVLLGHMTGVDFYHEFPPQQHDLFWTPADWAWIGGLLDVLLPAWFHGIPVLACRMRKFDPELAFRLIA
ncbi:MAG: AMP-binding protein, partial [Alphaproteobacteria bacterium]